MQRILLGGSLGILLCCSQAQACLNDRSLPDRESEFRSQYESDYTTHAEPPRPQELSQGPTLAALGATMLLGGAALAWFGGRKNG